MSSFVLPILSGLTGLLSGGSTKQTNTNSTTKQSQNQNQNYNNTNTSTPNLNPFQQQLATMFSQGAMNQYTNGTNMAPYTSQGLQQIQGQGNANSLFLGVPIDALIEALLLQLQGADRLQVRLQLVGKAAGVLHLELGNLPVQPVEVLLGCLELIVQKQRGRVGLLAKLIVGLFGEPGYQFRHHGLRLVPVGVREADRESRGELLLGLRGARFHNLNIDGPAHLLDDVFHGLAQAFLRIQIEGGPLNQLLELRAALDLLLHGQQPFRHLRADVAGHQALGNLLRRDAHHRRGNEGIRPQKRHHHGDDQPGEGGSHNPGTIAPQNIDIVLDIRRAAGNTDISLLGYHKSEKLSFLKSAARPDFYTAHVMAR